MTWLHLHEDVVHEFAEAQHIYRDRIGAWLVRRHTHRLARRRETYDVHRYFRDESYARVLERANAQSAARWADPAWKAAHLAEKARAADERRARRVTGRTCAECGAEVVIRSRMGRVPIYCSPACNHRAASRAWWRRHRSRTAMAECAVCPRRFKPRNSREIVCSEACAVVRRRWRDRKRAAC